MPLPPGHQMARQTAKDTKARPRWRLPLPKPLRPLKPQQLRQKAEAKCPRLEVKALPNEKPLLTTVGGVFFFIQ